MDIYFYPGSYWGNSSEESEVIGGDRRVIGEDRSGSEVIGGDRSGSEWIGVIGGDQSDRRGSEWIGADRRGWR